MKKYLAMTVQIPSLSRFEKSFDGLYPVQKKAIQKNLTDEYTFGFEGTGYILRGETAKWGNEGHPDFSGFKAEVYVDGKLHKTLDLPVRYTTRRYELAWNYQLPKQKHTVRIKLLNSSNRYDHYLQEDNCLFR